MFKQNKKKITVFVCLAVCVTFGIAAHNPDGKQQGFKNLKVLPKDISHDSLIHLMRFYTQALGVKCNFCHAPFKDTTQKHPDFASDDKPEKEIARKMITMSSEINLKYFNFFNSAMPDTIHAVTCITCHHGTPHPENMAGPEPPHGPGGPGGPGGNPPPPPAKNN